MTTEFRDRLTILGAGALAIVVFGGLCIRHNVPAIEAQLADRATSELRKARMSWAEVEMSGRDLTLSGVAPDAAAQDAALRTASVWGVRYVASALTTPTDGAPRTAVATADKPVPAPTQKFRTRLTLGDDRLVLDGDVPGERQRREFVELAQAKFSVATVEARLSQSGNAPDDWLQAAAVALDIVDQLVFGEVSMVDQSLHVTGITDTAAGDAEIHRLLAEELPEVYSSTAATGAHSELDAILRTSPGLAQRLATRSKKSTDAEFRAPRALDSSACEAEFHATISDNKIQFSVSSANLTPDSRGLLDLLAAVLKRCSGTRLTIAGHTDDRGLVENNLALSQRRAESVMRYLVTRGISLGRLSARGYGEGLPIVPNVTATDRATNRRIEFIFESE
ncbi:MAG: OmpA family protein [Gammaproteobacteria bacterium]|nr:OmpA family protein [Gammaproteobacteria bacterium]